MGRDRGGISILLILMTSFDKFSYAIAPSVMKCHLNVKIIC